jgi:glutathionyl-hydroquinone reductase
MKMFSGYCLFNISIGIAIFGSNFVVCYNELPSRQGLVVKLAQESWKLSYKRLVSELAPQSQSGAYVRPAAQFAGSGSNSKSMLPETNRYHLYLGNPCPWCHRVSLASTILRLSSSHVSVSNLEDNPIIATKGGWTFSKSNPDPVFNANDLKVIYDICSPGYSGKVTAPLLVDKKMRKIVSNESKDIVRMLGTYKLAIDDSFLNLYPNDLRSVVDLKNDWLYQNFNNAVYRAGFSTEQGPYDEAVKTVVAALESIECTLSESLYINGDQITESDVFLLPTVVRFDAVYSVLFKCTGRRIGDFKHIQRWVRDMYSIPGVPGTFDLQDAARSYYRQMFPLNPSRIVPLIHTPSYLQNPE